MRTRQKRTPEYLKGPEAKERFEQAMPDIAAPLKFNCGICGDSAEPCRHWELPRIAPEPTRKERADSLMEAMRIWMRLSAKALKENEELREQAAKAKLP